MAKLLYMVIALESMEIRQLGSLESATAKQFLENPAEIIHTSPVSFGGSYSCYTTPQLTLLAKNCGITTDGLSFAELINSLRTTLVAKYKEQGPLQSEDYYEAAIAKRRKLEPDLYAQFDPVVAVQNSRSARVSQANPTKQVSSSARPAGGTTKKVWDIADEIRAAKPEADAKTLRPIIISKCEAEGINGSTAGTQFAKWKNSQSWG